MTLSLPLVAIGLFASLILADAALLAYEKIRKVGRPPHFHLFLAFIAAYLFNQIYEQQLTSAIAAYITITEANSILIAILFFYFSWKYMKWRKMF